jgi:hypothetical protein
MDYLVEVDSEKIVRGMKPNFALLAELPCRGLIVTASGASKPYDFVYVKATYCHLGDGRKPLDAVMIVIIQPLSAAFRSVWLLRKLADLKCLYRFILVQ